MNDANKNYLSRDDESIKNPHRIKILRLRGEKGERGKDGAPGKDGKDGRDGKDGIGKDGKDGRDGDRGPRGFNGNDGKPGKDGKDGRDGSSDSPKQIRDKILSLRGTERLDLFLLKNGDKIKEMLQNIGQGGSVFVANSGGGGSTGGGTGEDGAPGTPGSVWRAGAGVPDNGVGIDGDFYLNNVNGDVYLRAAGAYSVVANIKGPQGNAGADGADGSNGADGADGSVWRDGTGAPSDSLGVNGDYYLDDATGNVYLKTGGTYSIVANIKGATGAAGADGDDGAPGAAGSVWRNGSGAPSSGLGVNGDYYLDDATGDVYLKAGGSYSVVANILGPVGSIDELTDVDITTDPVAKNDVLKWNGTKFVPVAYDYSFVFSLSAFDDGLSTGILAGSGVWKAAEAIAFTASYLNGPPATAMIQKSVNGGAYSDLNSMDGPAYTSGNNTAAVNYPTVDQYLRFQLVASDGVDGNTVQAASLYFYNNVFYGVASKASGFTESDIEALSAAITSSFTTSRTLNAGSGQYLVIAYPARYGNLHATGVLFNGIVCPMTQDSATLSITNSAGLTENYKVYVSNLANLGNSSLQLSTSSQLINKLYYGKTSATSGFSEADVEGLANSLASNDNTQTWNSVTAGAGEYLLFAFPTRLGIPTFFVGGFEGGFESPETVSITNANGYTENYYVWRSTNANLGATIVTTS